MLPRRLPSLRPVGAALAVVVALGACSSKGDGDPAPRATTTTSTTASAGPPTIAVTVTAIDPNGTAGPDEATVAAVKAALDGWVAGAVVGPLHSGRPAGDLSASFTPAALERLATDPAARATLVDEGMPPARTITAERANVALFSVAGPDGVVAVVAAQVDLALRAVGPTMDVDVTHYGELVLVQEGVGWKIDAFALETARDSRGA